ncbi:MAG TPA: NAD(P)/FAD-dependent oxidoreductase [Hyphomicrobium sp.]|nr:NAD(P)/FAD-dependent oxidoreductase [Hyphomicrobium sp.]
MGVAADIETAVVGGGVIGLAIARALAEAGQDVMLLERHRRLGSETSSRNSEVIHAGIYYPPGSMRARLCVSGKEMLYRFCGENGVAHKRCGKLLVATQPDEIAKLETIADYAARNGVPEMRRLTSADVNVLEPEVACVAAYLSSSTGIIDSHGLMQALEGNIEAAGGAVVLNTAVKRVEVTGETFTLETLSGSEAGTLTARNLILAAGLGGSALANTMSWPAGYSVPQTFPARGHYFAFSGRAPFNHLVYPMPTGAWLGVHLTLDIAGRARFGPDIEWRETVDYAFDDQGGARLARFENEIRRYWPGLPPGALAPDTVGVRPKIYREGEPAADFAIHGPRRHGINRLVALYGMESPGLTSSLAIGAYVADLVCGDRERP